MEPQMSAYEVTERTRIRRISERGTYDRETVHKILDEAILCHVGVAIDGKPRVIPTAILRVDEFVYIHGSANSQLLKSLIGGAPASIAVSFVDSLVASRSGFNCAVDYRSVVIFSDAAEEVTDPVEKERLLDAFVQHLIPGHKVRPRRDQDDPGSPSRGRSCRNDLASCGGRSWKVGRRDHIVLSTSGQ